MSRWVRRVDVADWFGLGRGHDVGSGDPGLAFIHLCFGAKSWTRLPKAQHIQGVDCRLDVGSYKQLCLSEGSFSMRQYCVQAVSVFKCWKNSVKSCSLAVRDVNYICDTCRVCMVCCVDSCYLYLWGCD